MIAHLSYVMCDGCGNPAEPGDDAREARALARAQGFVRAALDLCPECQGKVSGSARSVSTRRDVIGQPGTRRVAPAGGDTDHVDIVLQTVAGVVSSVDQLQAPVREHLVAATRDQVAAERYLQASRRDLAAALTRARDAGAQINELARFCGLSKPTVYRLLAEHADSSTTTAGGT